MFAPLVTAHLQATSSLGSTRLGSTLLGSTLLGSTTTPVSTSTPSPSPSPSGIAGVLSGATNALNSSSEAVVCTRDDVSVCGIVLRISGHQRLGQILEIVLGTPLRILLIVLLGIVLRRTLHRLIHRLAERIATGGAGGSRSRGWRIGRSGPAPTTPAAPGTSPLLATRRQARSRTLASVLRSVTTAVIGVIVVLMTLQELDFKLGPLLASVGVVGVALGLGAQSLVRDVLAGVFMIIEDQYGVGDVVDIGAATGAVEAVGLRVTRLRDVNGTVWYVRNGEIMRVGNQSQGWSRTVLDVNIDYSEDLDRVEEALLETAQQVRADPKFAPYILDQPEVWGVEALTLDGVVMRVVMKTQPLQQATVARELRRRIKQRFGADGIEIRPMPLPPAEVEEPEPARSTQDVELD